MKWLIPAKTFLLGEYAALAEESAIVLTTTPCFELSLSSSTEGIHPDSPAGRWWQQQNQKQGLAWHDPYAGLGGLGASSAQFLGSYLASCALQQRIPTLDEMLQAYYQCAWTGKGLRPSGYDVIAQSQHGCVYINKKNKMIQSYSWPFKELSFYLIHTGIKLATHHHLQNAALPQSIHELANIVEQAKQAFIHVDSQQLIDCINIYQQKLTELNLIAEHSLELIRHLKSYPEILAIKGCGALGSDVLLIITAKNNAKTLQNKLDQEGKKILATETSLYLGTNLLINPQ